MSGGFSDLVKVYIENLNLPKETKVKLLASNPKTLADVSLWLENNKEIKQEPKPSFNPFSSDTKSNIAKEIKLFSNNANIISGNGGNWFNSGDLVDTDEASWGLGIDRSQSGMQAYSCSTDSLNPSSANKSSATAVVKNSSAAVSESAVVSNSSASPADNTAQNNQPSYTRAASRTPEQQAQDNAIAAIRENINSSIEIIMQQMEEQGCISSAYNSLKEFFDSQMSMSSVCRVIFTEKTTADLLQKAQDGNLTKEEYWKTKISTAIDMLTGGRTLSAEERACLEERFAQYTPEELNALIDKIKYTNNEDYGKISSQVDKLIEEGRNLLARSRSDNPNILLNEDPNSIKSLMKNGSGKELMTFEEVWLAERGVEYSPEAIKEYDEAMAQYATVSILTAKSNNFHSMLDNDLSLLDELRSHSPDSPAVKQQEAKLEKRLLEALKTLYGDDEAKINAELQNISNGTMSYKDGHIVYDSKIVNGIEVRGDIASASRTFLHNIDSKLRKVLGNKSLQDLENEVASTYELAYGRKNATQLAKAFENDQESITGKVRQGVEYAGAGIMVAGMFICPPMAFSGALIASFGGIGVEALNESTRKEGLTQEAKQKITQELMTNAALFAVGGAAGKMGSAAKAALLAKNCPTLMACIADIGLDATISLIGDMVLTGEVDIEGEGLSQLMSVLAGHVRAGKFGKTREAVSNIIHRNKNLSPEHLAMKEHKQNLKALKDKYQYDKDVLEFIKQHKDDKELIAMLANEELSNANLRDMRYLSEEQIAEIKKLKQIERKEPLSFDDAVSLVRFLQPDSLSKLKERGLLNDIEGRTKPLNANDLITLAAISDEQWKIIEQRGLLKDFQGLSLDGSSIYGLGKLDDAAFQKVFDRNLMQIAKSFCKDGNFDYAALSPFIYVSDSDWPNVQRLLALRDKWDNLTPMEAADLASLSKEKFARLEEVISYQKEKIQFDSFGVRELLNLPEEFYNKLKNTGRLNGITNSEITILSAFSKYAGKNSIRDLSKTEKREFMMDLMRNKRLFLESNCDMKDIIGLIPANEAEYAQMMRKISQSLNISTKPVSDADKAKLEQDLKKLADVLKNTDLSDLEEINLTMPQKEFIAKAQELMEGLSDEEKAKVMDYFGFNIVDGKLTGYPNAADKDLSLADIKDQKTIDVINKMKGLVDSYTDNNFITVKDHPELNEVLKEISKLVPEIFNQIDGSKMPVETIKALQKIVQKPGFDNLSDSDKKVLITATLLHNTDKASGSTSESAFDAYYIGQKMGLSKAELAKLYKIVEASDLIEKFMNTHKNSRDPYERTSERERVFDYLAFMLKDSNNFELAQMLYSTKEADGLTRNLDKLLLKRIQEMKSSDFLLPQTSSAELEAHAQVKNVKGYNVKVVNSADIPDFYVYIHALLGATTGGSEMTNVANFDVFGLVGDGSVICASYVGNGKTGTIGGAKYGLIFDVAADNQYVAGRHDIWSQSKNVKEMLEEYFKETPNGYCNEAKQSQRRLIATELRKILNITEDEYIKRLDNLKQKANGAPLTLEKIKELDPEFGRAYETFLKKSGEEGFLRDSHHNEVLVTNPRVKGIFTKDINELPEELIKYAQENNIPIVIIQ